MYYVLEIEYSRREAVGPWCAVAKNCSNQISARGAAESTIGNDSIVPPALLYGYVEGTREGKVPIPLGRVAPGVCVGSEDPVVQQ